MVKKLHYPACCRENDNNLLYIKEYYRDSSPKNDNLLTSLVVATFYDNIYYNEHKRKNCHFKRSFENFYLKCFSESIYTVYIYTRTQRPLY